VEDPPSLADRRVPRLPATAMPAGALDEPSPGAPGDELALWHVSVTFAGPAVDPDELQRALRRLVDAQPFLASVRYAADRAEVSYWDEAEDVDDAAALGLRLWAEHRRVADLPDWRAVGIEVVDRDTLHARGQRLPPPTSLGEVRPW
jgi:hypothetical protein